MEHKRTEYHKDKGNHVNSIVARDFSGSSLDISAIQQTLLAVSLQLCSLHTHFSGRKCECSSSVIFFLCVGGNEFWNPADALFPGNPCNHHTQRVSVGSDQSPSFWLHRRLRLTERPWENHHLGFFFCPPPPPLQSANVSTAVAGTLTGRKPSTRCLLGRHRAPAVSGRRCDIKQAPFVSLIGRLPA